MCWLIKLLIKIELKDWAIAICVIQHLHWIEILLKPRDSCRGLAQLVEHRSPKPRVVGSSPSAPARFNFKKLYQLRRTLKISGRGCVDLMRHAAHHLGN